MPQSLGSSRVFPKLVLSDESEKAKALDSSSAEIFTPTQVFQMEKWSSKYIEPGEPITEEHQSLTEYTEGSDSSRCFPKVHAPTVDLSQLLQSNSTPKPHTDVSLTFSPSPSGIKDTILPRMEPASSN